MAIKNTLIKLKRSILKIPGDKEAKSIDTSTQTLTSLNEKLEFGEPLFVDNTERDTVSPFHAYILVGTEQDDDVTVDVNKAAVFKAFNSKDKADSLIFYDEENDQICDESGEGVPAGKVKAKGISSSDLSPTDTTKYHILCQPDDDSNDVVKFTLEDAGIYVTKNAVMRGGAWNDYAENRYCFDDVKPGMVVCENGAGNLVKSSEYLQPCAYIVSDTYGLSLGQGNTPVAISGKALVYVSNKDMIKVGSCVCADENGYAAVMPRNHIKAYPDRILGVVTEIPKENKYNDVNIDGRVWVKIK